MQWLPPGARRCTGGLAGDCMDLVEQLRMLRRRLDKTLAHFEHELDEIGHVGFVLDEIAAQHTPDAGASVARARRSTAEERALRAQARVGAAAVAYDWNLDGSAQVRINGGTSFHLQAKPAALLRVIATPGGQATNDGLIGWRSYAEAGVALAKYTGRAATPRNVTHTIYKLRKALREAGQNWFFIQTDHHGRVRFALRAEAAGPSPHQDAPR